MVLASLLLGGFAIFGSGLLSLIHIATEERITENERQALLNSLSELIEPHRYNNTLYDDVIQITSADELGSTEPANIYRARKDSKPVAAVLTVIAPDGYSGRIKMLVGINIDNTIAGVRVVSHKETPGLGDSIEINKSDWITIFNGKSLKNPDTDNWKVKPDGGVFDSLTGATITPRAVVKAIKKSLVFFARKKTIIFSADTAIDTALDNKDNKQ